MYDYSDAPSQEECVIEHHNMTSEEWEELTEDEREMKTEEAFEDWQNAIPKM